MDLLARNPFRLANLSSLAGLDEVKTRLYELDLCLRAGMALAILSSVQYCSSALAAVLPERAGPCPTIVFLLMAPPWRLGARTWRGRA